MSREGIGGIGDRQETNQGWSESALSTVAANAESGGPRAVWGSVHTRHAAHCSSHEPALMPFVYRI